jgi:hypothetical protein
MPTKTISSNPLHRYTKWFLAGFLAVPFAHQIMLWVLNTAGFIARPPFSFDATKPFGVPVLLSLSFWGGVWGILLGFVLERAPRFYWIVALVFGAIAPTLVAGLVVAPLKGQPAGGDSGMLITGLLVNAAWGLGTAALYRLFARGAKSDEAA